MTMWTMIFLLGVSGLLFAAWRTKHLAQHGVYEDDKGRVQQLGGGAREEALQREVTELRERIKVLERIATDDRGASRLSAEIDALRTPTGLEEGSKQ